MTKSGILLDGAIDVRYAATYGNHYLRPNGTIGEWSPLSFTLKLLLEPFQTFFFSVAYAGVVNTANPASTPAPPPYFPLRSSTLPPGKDNLPKLWNNLAVHRYY